MRDFMTMLHRGNNGYVSSGHILQCSIQVPYCAGPTTTRLFVIGNSFAT